MALTEEDLKALRLLMRDEIAPFRNEVNERFRDVDARIEGLYVQNEKREQEYLFIKEQLSRQEQQLAKQDVQLTEISKELSRHTQYFDDLDTRVTALESRVAREFL
jgi:hypothetical protein